MKNILFLDDDHNRWIKFQHFFSGKNVNLIRAEDYTQCVRTLHSKDSQWGAIFLDHDLGGNVFVKTDDNNTGSEVARWMSRSFFQKDVPIIIHSWNPTGAEYMKNTLVSAGFQTVLIAAFNSAQFQLIIEGIHEFIENHE